MPDYFKDLREHRQAVQSSHKAVTHRDAEKMKAAHLELARVTAQYDALVTDILLQLKDAVYPPTVELVKVNGRWSLGRTYAGEGSESFHEYVSVRIVLDPQHKPYCFEVERDNYKVKTKFSTALVERYVSSNVRCGLNEDELVSSLLQLHPPESWVKE
jgi:hypothetical protein